MLQRNLLRRLAYVVCSTLLLSTVPNTAAQAENGDLDDGYVAPDNAVPGFFGVEFRQQESDDQAWSWLGSINAKFAGCTELDGNCQSIPSDRMQFNAILPPCLSATQNYCIVELVSVNDDGSEVAGQFNSFFPDRGWNDYTGDESRGLPSGGPASLWTFPGVSHVGGELFFVRAGVSGRLVKNSFVVESYQAGIAGVSPVQQEFCEEDETGLKVRPRLDGETDEEFAARMERDEEEAQARGQTSRTTCSPRITYVWEPDDGRQKGRFGIGGGSGTGSQVGTDCVMRGNYQGNGVCMNRRAFLREMTFRLVVRIGQTPNGWLHGRMAKPDVSFSELAKPLSGVQIAITGKSISVPVVQAGMQYADLPASLQRDYAKVVYLDDRGKEQWTGFRGRGGCCAMGRSRLPGWETDMSKLNYQSYPAAWSEHGIDELSAWLPHIGDKATANLSTWSVRTLSADEMKGADECLVNDTKIVGLVTTNATQYTGGPPTYTRKTGTLDYRVAAPHYRSGGSKFFGIYDLIMRSDVARCLYGFSKAPLTASVSVVDDDGVTTVGTQNISEKDGWIKIAAYGFGFSAPTVKVKFSQKGFKGATTAKGKAKSIVRPKAKTIVCMKNKQKRTVTGTKPACPKGWKQKSS
jgi:hypothetical protein